MEGHEEPQESPDGCLHLSALPPATEGVVTTCKHSILNIIVLLVYITNTHSHVYTYIYIYIYIYILVIASLRVFWYVYMYDPEGTKCLEDRVHNIPAGTLEVVL